MDIPELVQKLQQMNNARQAGLRAQSTLQGRGPAIPTMALLGDSITAVTTEKNGAFIARSSRGFYTWAMQLLGYRARLVSRAGTYTGGVSSDTTTLMRNRLQADVLDLQPGYVHVLAGINDVMSVVPRSVILGNLKDIYDRVEQTGIRLVMGTLTPLSSTHSTAKRDEIEAVNYWIREQSRLRPGAILADYHAALASADGTWRVTGNAYSHDGIHPATGGAIRMGKVLADALAPVLSPTTILPTSNRWSSLSASTHPAPNLLANPLMTGTTGTLGASGATGQLATSWSLASYVGGGNTTGVTLSKVARTDNGPGEWQAIASTSASATTRIQQDFNTSANLQPGDTVQGAIEYETENLTQLNLLRVQLLAYDAASGYANRGTVADPGLESADSSTIPYTMFPARGVLQTPPLVYAANATGLNFAFDFGGVGTFRVTRALLRRTRG